MLPVEGQAGGSRLLRCRSLRAANFKPRPTRPNVGIRMVGNRIGFFAAIKRSALLVKAKRCMHSDMHETLRMLEKAEALWPMDALELTFRASAMVALGLFPQAERELREAINAAPRNQLNSAYIGHYQRYLLAVVAGNDGEAEEWYQLAQSTPSSRLARRWLPCPKDNGDRELRPAVG